MIKAWLMCCAILLTGCAVTGNTCPQEIAVVVRESGSGTRWAFNEMVGLYTKGTGDTYRESTTVEATVVNKTDVMLTTITGDVNSIGYSSIATLTSGVKRVSIDGVAPTKENVISGAYTLKRPFIFVVNEMTPLAEDFLTFVTGQQGQRVVAEDFVASDPLAPIFYTNGASGKLVLGGSSSVYTLAEKLVEAYGQINPKGKISLQGSDSATALIATQQDIYQIGMISRQPTAEEASSLQIIQVAQDAMAVIVQKDNPVDNLSLAQIQGIFTGETTHWEEVIDP